MSDDVGAIFSVLFAILFWGGIIWGIVAIRRNRKKPKPPEKPTPPTPPTPTTDAHKAFIEEVIAAIEREDANFYEIAVYTSSDLFDIPKGVRLFTDSQTHRDIYDYDAHGYYIYNETAWMLASQIAERFGGESSSYSSPYIVYGPKWLAEKREYERRQELERQRIENLRHL